MDLSTLKKLKGNIAREKRVGRGVGSGHGGHTSGRGLSVFSVFRAGTVVTPQKLLDAGIIKSIPKGGVKILAGTIPGKKLKLDGFHMSESVKKKLGS
ncbi:MAG: 50S ribosomal protein L15 [candidate division WWE3 bacterium GW2011_GWC1_47_10]|uniref:50S ribosomal protein L15 n=1 Tax=candidate division WWE3 bacterium GW2011_GWC1_47_10 TaxID=1619122 RepID=A0A0G1T9J3_UNCKA|nr:MAG: 50S ribosomal protein L15 [candidate division WWE3 bacterium GW2011_GWC1_47_10]